MNLSGQRVYAVADLGNYGSPRTWRRLIQRGEIGILRIGGAVRIPEAELERFLSERYTPPREMRKDSPPRQLAEVIDAVLPRKRATR